MSRVLGAVGRTFITLGVLILLFATFQLWGTALEESSHQDELGSDLVKQHPSASKPVSADPSTVAASLATVDRAASPTTAAPAEGDAVGVIRIPKIAAEKFIVEGTSKADLKKGPGHYIGTPLPGQAGNAAIAGHRTTYGAPFNRIDELVPGDQIEIYTAQGRFIYKVLPPPDGAGIERGPGWYTVRPSESSVLDNSEDNRLTLTACHPKYSASQRIVVTAAMVADPAPTTATTTTPTPTPSSGAKSAPPQASDLTSGFAGDPNALWPAIGLGLAAAGVWLATWLAAKRYSTVWCYIVGTPLFVFLLWFTFVFIDRWLPAI